MVELAEDELRNVLKVWVTVFASLTYSFITGRIIPKGFIRLLTILPIISIFIALPLTLTSMHFCGFTAFFISWLANYKLLLFAFGNPPLSFESDPPILFRRFLAVACLPISIKSAPVSQKPQNQSNPCSENSQNQINKHDPDQKSSNKSCPSPQKSQKQQKYYWVYYIIKGTLLALIIVIYHHSHQIPQKVLWITYFLHIYFVLEIILAGIGASAKLFIGFELEPPFKEPLLSTSLQDFWGKRWNLMVTNILRPTVFLPTQNLLFRITTRRLATMGAVMSTFIVSALMHELIFFYLGRVKPTFEVTWFFLLHGLCLCVEMAAKKSLGSKWLVLWWLSGPMTLGFIAVTGCWLFLPPLLRAALDTRGMQEYAALGALARNVTPVVTFQWFG